MAVKRSDVEHAAKLADKIADGLSRFPLKTLVPRRYRVWARSIADVLRDVLPLVPEN